VIGNIVCALADLPRRATGCLHETRIAVHRTSQRLFLGPTDGPPDTGLLQPPQLPKQADCINRNLKSCQKPDTLVGRFESHLPHYGGLFPLAGERTEPVKSRCMGELVFVPWGLLCAECM
jgi:hypothetical protein